MLSLLAHHGVLTADLETELIAAAQTQTQLHAIQNLLLGLSTVDTLLPEQREAKLRLEFAKLEEEGMPG
jgi:hypothetical protein